MYVLTQTAETFGYEEAGEDEQLVRRICAGEGWLFAQLYRRYYAKAFALAYGMTGGREEADDLAQEIFMRAYERLGSYDGRAAFATWFYRLAANHSLNYCRRERKHRSAGNGERHGFTLDLGANENVEATLLQRELQAQVRAALMTLKPEVRVLLVMKEIEGLSYEEIAERLECSTGTVASKLSRARKLLARKLEKLKGRI